MKKETIYLWCKSPPYALSTLLCSLLKDRTPRDDAEQEEAVPLSAPHDLAWLCPATILAQKEQRITSFSSCPCCVTERAFLLTSLLLHRVHGTDDSLPLSGLSAVTFSETPHEVTCSLQVRQLLSHATSPEAFCRQTGTGIHRTKYCMQHLERN